LEPGLYSKFAKQVKRLAARAKLQAETGLSETDLELLALHLTRKKGFCHKCGKPLRGLAVEACKNCKSLNLDW
jgi:hypothetical protein